MYLKLFRELRGTLVDVGSGAGFPGLALKIAEPRLVAVLLEPVGKKRVFLKEVVRECHLEGVEVRSERAGQFCRERPGAADTVTVRAVGAFETVLPAAIKCLTQDGQTCLWLTRQEAATLSAEHGLLMKSLHWSEPIPVPLSNEREIWCGHVSRET
jgi:16S rRNA (guanine527-N7)-methyltransferase